MVLFETVLAVALFLALLSASCPQLLEWGILIVFNEEEAIRNFLAGTSELDGSS